MFNKSTYVIKEHVSFMKLTDRYDIIDPETGQIVANVAENLSGWKKYLRLLVKKAMLPTTVEVKDLNSNVLYSIKKSPTFLRAKVTMHTADGAELGFMRSRILSIGGAFDVFRDEQTKVAEIKGKWTGWDFNYTDTNGNQLGQITKQWAGIGKELFTNADTYVITVDPSIAGNEQMVALLILGGLAVDVVFKEQQG